MVNAQNAPVTTIRRAVVDDAGGIGRVHVAAARAAYRRMLPDPYLEALDETVRAQRWRDALVAGSQAGIACTEEGETVVLVAEDDRHEIVGIAAIGDDRDGDRPTTGELHMINISPTVWGQGVATQLLRAAEEELRGLGFTDAVLWVLEANHRARRFYEREGWTIDGAVKEETRRGFVARQVRYRRTLP